MDWRAYQDFTVSTAIYRGAGLGGAEEIAYCGLGLGEEALEIAGTLLDEPRFDREACFEEIGDATYYIAREYAALGVYPKDFITEASASPGFARDHYLEFCNLASKPVGMVKKAMRKEGHAGVELLKTDPEKRAIFIGALDATLTSLGRFIGSLGGTLPAVLDQNREKVTGRKKNKTLHERTSLGGPR